MEDNQAGDAPAVVGILVPFRRFTVRMAAPPSSPRRWRLLTVFSWTLALAAAAGATSPRPRTAPRERGGRATILRGGSPRANERQGWVIPDPTSPGARFERDDDTEARQDGADLRAALPGRRPVVVGPEGAIAPVAAEAPPDHHGPASRPYAGRAPPSC